MKKKSIFIIICVIFFSLLIPLLINILFKFNLKIWWLESEWSAGDALSFYGQFLSFIGTIVLGIISVWQTKKANSISRQLLDKDLIDSTDFIQLENKIDVSIKYNNDTKIKYSTHHRMDFGANILLEKYNEKVKKFNEYAIKLFFYNSSDKNHIKRIELESFMCIQDPDEKGFFWNDGSTDPIPLKLEIDIFKDVYLNWISNNKFYTQMKIYCEPDMCFDSMMQNKVNLCFLFQFNIYSFSNVKTEMLYKIWLSKGKNNQYEVINTNSTILNMKVI